MDMTEIGFVNLPLDANGRYHTGPVSVFVAGKTYTHPGVTIDVL